MDRHRAELSAYFCGSACRFRCPYAVPVSGYRFWMIAVIFVTSTLATKAAAATYGTDCSANERLSCQVEEGGCEINPRSDDYPSAPFDLRVSPYLVANPGKKPDIYQLWVNISWLPTHESNINKTQGFELTILNKETNRQRCFTMHLANPVWDDKDRYESTRFRFSTEDLFEFGMSYFVEVQSLPKPFNKTTTEISNFIGQDVVMPGHPDHILIDKLNQTGYLEPEQLHNMALDLCTPSTPEPKASDHASRWIAAFRYVYIQPKLRSIYVDFIAAPSQYCFEEYELRIVKEDDHRARIVTIRTEDLVHEVHGGILVAFGNHTFHDIDVGTYEIGVSPVAYSKTGRCLCPMSHRTCSCSLSIWSDVKMPPAPSVVTFANPCDYLPPVKLPYDCPMKDGNGSHSIVSVDDASTGIGPSSAVAMLAFVVVAALVIIVLGLLFLFGFYRRYKRRDVTRLYLLPMTTTTTRSDMINGSIASKMAGATRPVTISIVYARDCPEYERAVRDLVSYLSSQCYCNVRVDYLSSNEIAVNKFDWAYKSIQEVDRVLVMNSYGSYTRYQAKLVASEDGKVGTTVVERANGSEFDDLFLLQLEFLAQESQRNSRSGAAAAKKFISVRFPFTPEEFVLPHGNPHIRYELPKHLRPLMIDLHHLPYAGELDDDGENVTSMPAQLKQINKDDYDNCIEGQKLKNSIEAMTQLIHDQSDWFERLHIRRTPTTNEALLATRPVENVRLPPPSAIDVQHKPADWIHFNEEASTASNFEAQDETQENAANGVSNDRTGNYADSVDSGVAVSADKRSDKDVTVYSPKRKWIQNGQPNGAAFRGNEDDAMQRLLA